MTQDDAVQAIINAGDRLAEARANEMALEDERPLVKDEAIKRLMQHGAATSATAAEKIVEKDAEYAAHRAKQVEAVREAIKARAYYDASVARARLMAGAAT